VILLALGACITLTVDPLPPATGVDDCAGCVERALSGEVIALVNGKLTAAETTYTANAVMEDGTVLGASVFLHDPATSELGKLGNLDLGADDLGDGALERLAVRDLAWDPDAGLWALGIDAVNDEWLLLRVEVPDWSARNQLLPATSYAFRTTDPIYWEESVVALAFVGGELVLGTQGDAGGAGGRLYRSALPTGWSVDPAWPDDPEYYADAVLTEVWTTFPDGLGLAGDIADTDGEPPLATIRAERSSAGALDENWLWTLGDPPAAAGTAFDVVRNQDVEGLAVIDGVPWGVDTEAVTWRADGSRATPGYDLSAAFTDPDDGIRLRGAARVVLP
jgi:hypothetical protein